MGGTRGRAGDWHDGRQYRRNASCALARAAIARRHGRRANAAASRKRDCKRAAPRVGRRPGRRMDRRRRPACRRRCGGVAGDRRHESGAARRRCCRRVDDGSGARRHLRCGPLFDGHAGKLGQSRSAAHHARERSANAGRLRTPRQSAPPSRRVHRALFARKLHSGSSRESTTRVSRRLRRRCAFRNADYRIRRSGSSARTFVERTASAYVRVFARNADDARPSCAARAGFGKRASRRRLSAVFSAISGRVERHPDQCGKPHQP